MTVDMTVETSRHTLPMTCDAWVEVSNGGYERGVQAERARFWDGFFSDPEQYAFGQCLFAGGGWNDTTFMPDRSFSISNAYMTFRRNMATDWRKIFTDRGISVTIDAAELDYTWNGSAATVIDGVIFGKTPTRLYNTFDGAGSLREICTPIPVTESVTFNSAFNGMSALEEIRFSGTIGKSVSFPASSLLSQGTLENIVGCLADLTGQTAQTLTLHPDAAARLTEAQKETAAARNWTLVY